MDILVITGTIFIYETKYLLSFVNRDKMCFLTVMIAS